MALATYADLIAEVPLWLRRTDLTAEIPTWIAMFEAQANRRLRCRRMLSRGSLSITSQLVAAPADFVAPRSLRLTSTTPVVTLKWVSDEQMDGLLDGLDYTSGPPRHYTLEGTNFRFSPDPGAGPYTASLSYYAQLPALGVSQATNWLMTSHPDAYLYGTLMQSAPYLKADDRLQTWATLLQTILDDINISDSGQGGALEPMPSTSFAGYI